MQKTFSCPVCGTRYRHKGMAARCQRTDVCRWYHAPGGERRRAYALQVRVCAAVAYICAPVSAQARVAEVEAQAWKALHLVDQITDGLDALSVSRDIYRRVNDAAIRDLESIWAPTSTVDVVHIVAIVASVVADLRHELADWLAARPETDALWRDMEHALDGLYDLFDPEGTENYEHADDVPRLYAALRRKVFGPEKAAPQARLYLLGGRFGWPLPPRIRPSTICAVSWGWCVSRLRAWPWARSWATGEAPRICWRWPRPCPASLAGPDNKKAAA